MEMMNVCNTRDATMFYCIDDIVEKTDIDESAKKAHGKVKRYLRK